MSTNEKIETLTEALQWLTEMAGYAVDHLEPEWARRGGTGNSNALDLHDALSKARHALEITALGVERRPPAQEGD